VCVTGGQQKPVDPQSSTGLSLKLRSYRKSATEGVCPRPGCR